MELLLPKETKEKKTNNIQSNQEYHICWVQERNQSSLLVKVAHINALQGDKREKK